MAKKKKPLKKLPKAFCPSKKERETAREFFETFPVNPTQVIFVDTHDPRMDLTIDDMKPFVPKCTDMIHLAFEPSRNTRRLMEDIMRKQHYPKFKLGEFPDGN
jgi:hypothetical protein